LTKGLTHFCWLLAHLLSLCFGMNRAKEGGNLVLVVAKEEEEEEEQLDPNQNEALRIKQLANDEQGGHCC
jgi:hypothetical protein